MINLKNLTLGIAAIAVVGVVIAYGCGNDKGGENGTPSSGNANLSGDLAIDGSSTVFPISEAIAEEFSEDNTDVRPTVASSGTGGGFKKFANGEIDIAGASRPIEQDEIDAAKAKGIEFIEIPVAFDGLTVVVHPSNTFAKSLTVEELKKIWAPDSTVKNWNQVRAGFPDLPIVLYGPGTDSGTFDYFTKAIVGEEGASRKDFQASEDDNQLVQGVAGDKGALGYFGFAYFVQNKDKLTAIGVGPEGSAVTPSLETIADGTYQPLSRPIFWYVNKKSYEEKPAVKALVEYMLKYGKAAVERAGYVALPDTAYAAALERVQSGKTGSVFQGAEIGVKIEDLLKR